MLTLFSWSHCWGLAADLYASSLLHSKTWYNFCLWHQHMKNAHGSPSLVLNIFHLLNICASHMV